MTDLFSGHGWRLFRDQAALPDGRMKFITRAQSRDSVHILAFPEPGSVFLLREFRPFSGGYIWMLPSGKIEPGEDIAAAAQRELREETGYRSDDLKPYCTSHYSEAIANSNHLFLGRALVPDPLAPNAVEWIEVHTLPLSEAITRVLESESIHTISAYGLLRFAREFPPGI